MSSPGNNTEPQKYSRPKSRGFSLNLNTIFLIIGLVIISTFILNLFNRPLNANEIDVSRFVSNIKSNVYSVVDIRDDGKAVGEGKHVVGADTSDKPLSFPDSKTTKVAIQNNSDFQEVSLDDFYNAIRPLSVEEALRTIINPGSLLRVSDVYVGKDFIIGKRSLVQGKDLLVTKTSEAQFEKKLIEEGETIDDLPVVVNYLRTAMGIISADELSTLYSGSKLKQVWELNNVTLAVLKDDQVRQDFVYTKPVADNFSQFLQGEGIQLTEASTRFKSSTIPQIPWGDIISIGLLGGLGLLAIFMFRGIQGSGSGLMKFGQSKARMIFGKKPDITFKDVAGVDESKEELREVVLFLKEPKRFLKLGARIPKGLLMVGAPGTGKTLLARAVAGEAGVPFFHTSGSEFEEMLVGAGASRVRDLFEKAKKAAPAIIFIDEIDAVARKRGTTVQSSTTEQTLNQILVEMDGFEKNVNVIVIAATNRPDVLDPAILRPGRFDRRIVLDLPDIEGRKQIIAIHAKNKPLGPDVDMDRLARRTVGYSGADIENMLNEAAIIVAKANRSIITFADLEEAANKVQIGPAKKRKRSEKELKMTAYHEAGHAIVMKLTPEHDPVHRVTIVSRGMALGYTMPLPETDQLQMSKTQMLSKITSLVAGFATEEMMFGDVTSGASNDIEKATSLARKMVKQFGMSKKLGLVKYGEDNELQYLGYGYGEQKDYSEETARYIDEEVRSIINTCYEAAKKILTENKPILDAIAKTLLEKEVLESEEFNAFFEPQKVHKPEKE